MVDGHQLLVDGLPFHIRGVCWNPIPKGGNHPADLDFAAATAIDIPLMQAARINAVRTYEPVLDSTVLDLLLEAEIRVLPTVHYGGVPDVDTIRSRVEALRGHRAVLMWLIGNEWNYGAVEDQESALTHMNEAAALIREIDTSLPIATVYGELPPAEVIANMPLIDVWGVNVYSGISFGERFAEFKELSSKPFFFAEYGADAYNTLLGREDPESQAEAVLALTEEILSQSSALTPNGNCLGGTLFEWSDEWWKAGSPTSHDVGGVAPGGGPYPDLTFNEEWWGLVDVDRVPRPAYDALAALYRRFD